MEWSEPPKLATVLVIARCCCHRLTYDDDDDDDEAISAGVGVRTTSPTETNHKALKSCVLDGKSDLLKLQTSLEQFLEEQEDADEIQVSDERVKIRMDWIGKKWLGDLPTQVSLKCLKHLNEFHKMA